MSDLRKLMDHLVHIEKGGEFIRTLNPVTGRIFSQPVIEAATAGAKKWPTSDAEIRAFQRANPPLRVDGLIGEKTLAQLQQLGYVPPAEFKPVANKASGPGADIGDEPAGDLGTPAASNLSDFSKDSNAAGKSQYSTVDPAMHGGAAAIAAKTKSQKNPNGNGGHDGSGIAPDADPEDPKLWPAGVRAAADFGYLDPEGMWIPTPFHFRTEEGKWRVPKNSPANLVGIPMNTWTPFQQKLEQLKSKNTSNSGSAIEKQVAVQLPGGAPQIPGYKQVDAGRFSTDGREPGLNKTLGWQYAYQKGKNIVLIAPMLFPGMKPSIGRLYPSWADDIGNIRSGYGALKTANGTIHVSGLSFNYNDMIFDVVIHSTDPDVGPQVLQTIKI